MADYHINAIIGKKVLDSAISFKCDKDTIEKGSRFQSLRSKPRATLITSDGLVWSGRSPYKRKTRVRIPLGGLGGANRRANDERPRITTPGLRPEA